MNKLNILTPHTQYYTVTKGYNDDCGFDVFTPKSITIPAKAISFKINFEIRANMVYNDSNVGYMLVPRSSTGSKTPLRLSNSVGIIDPSYRGDLMAFVDNISSKDHTIEMGSRIIQLVAFNGLPIRGNIVNKLDDTKRGTDGFGSTGN